MYYFIRVNGDTLHNNPNEPDLYVPGEPPRYPNTYFDALNYCLQNNFIRIGWPGTGDLNIASKTRILSAHYNPADFKDIHREYLWKFFDIEEKSVVLMPDKARPGDVYLGKVTRTYHYFHDIPTAPYEHSHRLGVQWLREEDEKPICIQAEKLGIGIVGGFWTRAFHALETTDQGRTAIPSIAKYLQAG